MGVGWGVGQVSMAKKMATLESAEKLLEDLRESSWDAALKGHTHTPS